MPFGLPAGLPETPFMNCTSAPDENSNYCLYVQYFNRVCRIHQLSGVTFCAALDVMRNLNIWRNTDHFKGAWFCFKRFLNPLQSTSLIFEMTSLRKALACFAGAIRTLDNLLDRTASICSAFTYFFESKIDTLIWMYRDSLLRKYASCSGQSLMGRSGNDSCMNASLTSRSRILRSSNRSL